MQYMMLVAAVTGLVLGHPHSGPAGSEAEEGGPTSVFLKFPVDPSSYVPEVAALIADGVVDRYGDDEFAAVVMSHEIHQHIGIYTIVGAKMGVRAREVLNAPRRSVEVTVKTLPNTPLACAVDGIQAAMGSTYGQGLIAIEPVLDRILECTFAYKDQNLRMRLKPEYSAQVEAIIKECIGKYGNLTPQYFEGIRQACFRLWNEWDRRAIFDETFQDPSGKSESGTDKHTPAEK